MGRDTERQRLESLGLFKQADGKGFIRLRKNPRILRFKRYSKVKNEKNYRRVNMMLFYPWFDELTELEDDIECEYGYNTNFDKLALNKKMFESPISMSYDQALLEIEQEVQAHWDMLDNPAADSAHEAHAYLMRNTFLERTVQNLNNENRGDNQRVEEVLGPDREELEDEYGYHAELQQYDDICQVRAERDDGGLNMPDLWPEQE